MKMMGGIQEDNIEHIFDPFFTTKRGKGYVGLGLHILYNIVSQRLKGKVQCENKKGKGARFTIQFPVEE